MIIFIFSEEMVRKLREISLKVVGNLSQNATRANLKFRKTNFNYYRI